VRGAIQPGVDDYIPDERLLFPPGERNSTATGKVLFGSALSILTVVLTGFCVVLALGAGTLAPAFVVLPALFGVWLLFLSGALKL
jgi:hypothetical protein